jgi:deoxycytidylate deaminase
MPAGPLPTSRPIELVFGLVGPTGVDQDLVCECLKKQLAALRYETRDVSFSEIIAGYDGDSFPFDDEHERISRLMDRGDDLRGRQSQAHIVALLGILKIRALRSDISGNPNEPSETIGIAYIVRSFKRIEEVNLFRDVYGKAFNLISIYASSQNRIDNLRRRFSGGSNNKRTPTELALSLMIRDYREEDQEFGQRVGDTFPLADYFVVSDNRPRLDEHIQRLVRLVFGDPYISPTIDEQSMYFAQASALRSLDLSRQVGAAIVDDDGSIISTGCNDVPKAHGGLYWAGDENCARDFELGEDANVRIKQELVVDALRRLKPGLLREFRDDETIEKVAESLLFERPAILGDSKLFDVIEFGRSVHAEMAAISHAAKVGSALKNSRLFCTTFPCHICARHIVASGVKEVVFIEPYEKSRVSDLYKDSIVVEPIDKQNDRVVFRSFVGVAPRRYLDFFQPSIKRKTKSGTILQAQNYGLQPKLRRITFAYTLAEEVVINLYKLPPKKSLGETK